MVANWSYYKRGWRNGTSTTTDPVWTDLDHTGSVVVLVPLRQPRL